MSPQASLSFVADRLTRRLARPVLHQTELTAEFDVDISWMPGAVERKMAPALTLGQALQEKAPVKS
jgi:uncharacterized protein (TIGR03435 family)